MSRKRKATVDLVENDIDDYDVVFADNKKGNWFDNSPGKRLEEDMIIHKDDVYFMEVNDDPASSAMDYIQRFVDIGNKYAIYLLTHRSEPKVADFIKKAKPNGGLTSEQMTAIKRWAIVPSSRRSHSFSKIKSHKSRRSNKTSVISKVFATDWDGTITCVEGMVVNKEDVDFTKIPIGHILTFLVGGEERLRDLQDMFLHLNEHNVATIVLTHNSNARAISEAERASHLIAVSKLDAVMASEDSTEIDSAKNDVAATWMTRKLYLYLFQRLTLHKSSKWHLYFNDLNDDFFCSLDNRDAAGKCIYKKSMSICQNPVIRKFLSQCAQFGFGGRRTKKQRSKK
jgi:hypothetical protein